MDAFAVAFPQAIILSMIVTLGNAPFLVLISWSTNLFRPSSHIVRNVSVAIGVATVCTIGLAWIRRDDPVMVAASTTILFAAALAERELKWLAKNDDLKRERKLLIAQHLVGSTITSALLIYFFATMFFAPTFAYSPSFQGD